MSVILECQPGDECFCIQSFLASPEGEELSWNTSRRFQVGDQLRYLGSLQHPHSADRSDGWLVRFEAGDGKRYLATQTYFVSEECWRRLERFFRSRFQPPSEKPPRVMGIG
jgi:hypothetical protein